MAVEVVAFANHPSGVILIGVENTTGKTAGLACSQVPQGGGEGYLFTIFFPFTM